MIVNDALTSYIEAHDDVFKVSVKRLVPNPRFSRRLISNRMSRR